MFKTMLRSLLSNLSRHDAKRCEDLTMEQCEIALKLTGLRLIQDSTKTPGQRLLKTLDRSGYSIEAYNSLMTKVHNAKIAVTYYKPQFKMAILIANDKYEHLSKLVTPVTDCESVAEILEELGFVVITLKNMRSNQLKDALTEVLGFLPKDAYCFILYAGHGYGVCGAACMLGVECPALDVCLQHVVTESWLLELAAQREPDLVLLVMDMCRVHIDRESNPRIYSEICELEPYSIHRNLVSVHTTQPRAAAYEVAEVETSRSLDEDLTYEMQSGLSAYIVGGSSQYVCALRAHLAKPTDLRTLFDNVHTEVEASHKRQRPITLLCGAAKRSLWDPVAGDVTPILQSLVGVTRGYSEHVTISAPRVNNNVVYVAKDTSSSQKDIQG